MKTHLMEFLSVRCTRCFLRVWFYNLLFPNDRNKGCKSMKRANDAHLQARSEFEKQQDFTRGVTKDTYVI